MARETDPKPGVGKIVLVGDSAALRKMLATAFLSDGFKTCIEGTKRRRADRRSEAKQARRNRPRPLDACHERFVVGT
jgi:hypothetical protein